MNAELRVPIRVWLPGHVYRAYAKVAAERGCEVGDLLATAAERSVKRPQRPSMTPPADPRQSGEHGRKPFVRMTPERLEFARQMRREGYDAPAIGRALGISRSSIYNHWNRIVRDA